MSSETRNWILGVLVVIEGYILHLAQVCESQLKVEDRPYPFNNDIFSPFYPSLCKNISSWAFWSFIILLLAYAVLYIIKTKKDKEWLKTLFKHILDQNLYGDQYETRITLYIKKRGITFFFQYLCYSLWIGLSEQDFRYCKSIPNPFKHYLRQYVRWTYPEPVLSQTYFNVVESESQEADSAVEKCYKSGQIVSVTAPYITDIKLPELRSELNKNQNSRVNSYMQKTGMKSYEKLRSLQRKANTIYAFPVLKNHRRWAVVVIDNNSDNNPLDIETRLKDDIANYQKIIQLTITTLNL